MTQLTTLMSTYTNIFGADLLRYVLGAGGTYLVVNILLSQRLAKQKIRPSDPPNGQIKREVLASLRTVLIFTAAGTSIALGASASIMTIYLDIAEHGWAYFLFSIAALIVLHDAWFYWSHRALHYPPLFRRFHRLHHRSHQPTPFTSYSFDIGEAFINAIYLPLILLVLPAHPIALFIFVTHMMLRNAIGHSGYEIFPANADGLPVFGWLTSVTHHDMHHAHAGFNLGLYFTWWDKLMGTEHPDYLRRYASVAPRLQLKWLKIGTLCLLSVFAGFMLSRAEAFELKGSYATPGLDAIIDFQPCETDAGVRCARLVWLWNSTDKRYAKVGDMLATDLTFDGAKWRGRMLNPENGWTFHGTIGSATPEQLRLQGCAGLICINQIWRSTASLKQILEQTP